MHRGALLGILVVLVAAGCVKPDDAPAAVATPTAEATASAPIEEEAAPEIGEPFVGTTYFGPGYKLGPLPEPALEPERLDPAAFFSMQFQEDQAWSPWAMEPKTRAYEIIGDLRIVMKIQAAQPATQTTPKALGFPGVGGWVGTTESRNLFYLMHDAPERMEAGVTYRVEATIPMPKGGFLLPPGQAFSPHPWAAYKTADGSPVQYVLGGDDPALVTGTLRRIEWPAVTPVELLSKSGEMRAHPGFTTKGNPDAVELPLQLPEGTVYVVIETTGAPKGGGHVDVDIDVVKGGEVVLGGHGPTAAEKVVLGPGNIAAYGRDLAVHVSSASAAGNTWTAKATAYVRADAAPAP